MHQEGHHNFLSFNSNRILLIPVTMLEDMRILVFALLAMFEEFTSFTNVSISLSDEERILSIFSMKLVTSFKVLFWVTQIMLRRKLAKISAWSIVWAHKDKVKSLLEFHQKDANTTTSLANNWQLNGANITAADKAQPLLIGLGCCCWNQVIYQQDLSLHVTR